MATSTRAYNGEAVVSSKEKFVDEPVVSRGNDLTLSLLPPCSYQQKFYMTP